MTRVNCHQSAVAVGTPTRRLANTQLIGITMHIMLVVQLRKKMETVYYHLLCDMCHLKIEMTLCTDDNSYHLFAQMITVLTAQLSSRCRNGTGCSKYNSLNQN